MRRLIRGLGLALLVGGLAASVGFGDDAKPKYTIEEVMDQAHGKKSGLLPKVAKGTADKAEKEKLVELYAALGQNKPPKGDEKAWKQKTDALVKAAKAVAGGDQAAAKQLGKAANCKACHDAHKE